MIKTLKPLLKGYGKYALACIGCVMIEAILEILMPFLMSRIVDVGIANRDLDYVFKVGGMMLVMALVSLSMGAMASRLSAKAGMGFGANIRKALFDKIQMFSFANIDKFSTASLITRATTDTNNVQNMFMMLNKMAIRSPMMLIVTMILAMNINAELVMIFFLVVPILGISLYLIIKISFPMFEKMLKKYDALNASIQENLISIRVVKAFVRSAYEKLKFKKSNDELMETSMKAERVIILNMPLMQFSTYLCIILVLWFGGDLVMDGTMLEGELMSFITYISQILMALMMLSMIFVNILISSASFERIVEVLNEEIDIQNKENAVTDEIKDGSIEFKDVTFAYKKGTGEPVLSHINLSIKSGETIGIIGGTGSAKTSLVQLIPRLYDVSEGSVTVGGRDVRGYDIEVLRDAVGMVLQKNVLFSGTIEENLRWGNKNATHEEIVEACKQACAHDFIMSFPNRYDTWLEQGGSNVSGGQKQRLCIARALLKKPKIIILDDSTSAVDMATDASIRAAFRRELKDTTTLIIAQRIASIQDSDRIIVMDDGQIDAIGTHEELLKTNAIYQEVYNSQMKGGISE